MSTTNPVPNTIWKTHYLGIMLSMVNAAILGWQGQTGQAVNLSDPVVWTQLFGFLVTIVGFFRNKPTGT